MNYPQVACPGCAKTQRLSGPVPEGRLLHCSGCNRRFSLKEATFLPVAARPVPTAVQTAPPPVPLQRVIAPPEVPVLSELAEERQWFQHPVVLIGGALTCLLMLVGGAIITLRYWSLRPAPANQQLGSVDPPNTPTSPTTPGNPPQPTDKQPPAEPPWLPADKQREVNQAIEKGVAWLRKKQLPEGTWPAGYPLGLAALPGLTLLECGVRPEDPQIQRVAQFVRSAAPNYRGHTETYEISLAILFLDRLRDPIDRALIRSLALRLVAGQRNDGGWTYGCQQLTKESEEKLDGFLTQTRDRSLQRAAVQRPTGGVVLVRPGSNPTPPVQRTLSREESVKLMKELPNRLQTIPAVKFAGAKPPESLPHAGSDNSNTQFAILALWAASRHDIPLERALQMVAKRFQQSQSHMGTWGYHSIPFARFANVGSPAMTGVGLLGLAIGHGLKPDRPDQKPERDPQIDNGLEALVKFVRAGGDTKQLYFLWTLERVAVLYKLRKLDDLDWYRHGVDLLLPAQKKAGQWQMAGYHGSTPTVDTCLALLFLHRANLTADLSGKLETMIQLRRVKP